MSSNNDPASNSDNNGSNPPPINPLEALNALNALGSMTGGANILGGLSSLLGNITKLAEAGSQLQGEREFTGKDGKPGRVQFGLSIKTLGDEGGLAVEPFGNVKTDAHTGEATIDEVREPITDVFEEDNAYLVVAELPGVDTDHLTVSVDGDVLTIDAESSTSRYHKELLLAGPADAAAVAVTTNNGIAEIRVAKAARAA